VRFLALVALLALALLVTATASGEVAGSSRRAAGSEGVASLTYAPKPFYDDLSRMKVRFTTTGRARSAFEYVVVLFITGIGTGSSSECDANVISGVPGSSAPSSRIHGAPGQTYTVWLLAGKNDGGVFCPGRASLNVVSTSATRPSSNRDLRTLRFEILRRPSRS
jgi:hypothetical protein